jgi:hypothetical protein
MGLVDYRAGMATLKLIASQVLYRCSLYWFTWTVWYVYIRYLYSAMEVGAMEFCLASGAPTQDLRSIPETCRSRNVSSFPKSS